MCSTLRRQRTAPTERSGFRALSSGAKSDHSDYLGTFTRQTNSTQSTTATRTYDAFGLLVSSTGTPQGPFGFVGGSGYQEDADSGLKLLGHRYYDASTGRFLTRDPVKDGRNWYGYCENGPTIGVDANGLVVHIHRGSGWTDAEWQEIKHQLNRIAQTKRGGELTLPEADVTVQKGGGGSHEHSDGDGHYTIVIDPEDKNKKIDTTKGKIHPTTVRILAHEFGHAVGGGRNDNDGNMDNINKNENPIVTALGEPARTKY